MKILIIDIETTGFLGAGGKIVEIGIVSLNLKNGNKEIIYNQVVHERPISKKEVEESWIVSNGFMNVEEIRTSPQLINEKEFIQSIIDSYPIGATAYNNNFDFGFLESRGFVFNKKLPCPMKISTNICKLPGKFGKYKYPKVEEAYKHFFPKSKYIEKHRGADDAFHEADIVLELFNLGFFKV